MLTLNVGCGVHSLNSERYVIEHVKNPQLLLREIVRVCFGTANVRCPHRFGWKAKGRWHLSHFKASWFTHELTALGVLFTVKCNYYQRFFLLALPDELEIDIYIG